MAATPSPGLPAGELVPVRYLWERLGEHRSGEDDVDGDDVFLDGPLVASAGQNLFEEVLDFGLKRADLLVVDDGAAMEWEDEFVAGGDRLFEELDEGSRGRLVAQCGDPCVLEHEVEGAQRQRCEEGAACGLVAVEGSDPGTRLLGDGCHRHSLAVAPDGDRGGSEDGVAIGRGVTAQPAGIGLCLRRVGHFGACSSQVAVQDGERLVASRI